MKNKIIKLSALFLLLGMTSCEMEMNSPEVTITPVESEFVKKVGNTIYVLKNSPLYFSLSGNPDNIAFWSGEWMHAYQHRSRTIVERPTEAELSFTIQRQYGNWKANGGSYGTYLRMYYTTDPIVLQNDFKNDSTLLRDAHWTEMLDENGKPLDPTTDRGGKKFEHSYNMADIKGAFRIAFKLNYPKNPDGQVDGKASNPTYTISSFKLDNILSDGNVVAVKPAEFGLRPILMSNYDYAPYYNASVGKDPYKTFDPFWSYVKSPAMPKKQYLWDLNSIASASQSFAFSGDNDNLNPLFLTKGFESWLFSAEMDLGELPISSDTGVAIKEVSSRLTSYRYYYKETGKYKATFVPTSVTIDASKAGQLIEFDIEVVDVLPQ